MHSPPLSLILSASAAFASLALVACDPGRAPTPTQASAADRASTVTAASSEAAEPTVVGPRPATWVTARVAEARTRLQADRAGVLVWNAIEAHGGLQTWLAKSTVAFEFDYQPLGQPERGMHTYNQVDLWSARARQAELPGGAGAEATLGWDGERAWITPAADAFPSSARFWSLTPYYFMGMPFVAADPGTRYERLADATLDETRYQVVKLTYGEGVGDAPDDYYVLYLHPETRRLAALRYVVSYPGRFAAGAHSPEKLMRYSEFTTVDGLQFAQRLDTSAWDAESATPGDVVTHIAVSRITLGETWPASIFTPPSGAVVSEDL